MGKLREQWIYEGAFMHNGLTYRKGVNDHSAERLLNDLEPDYEYRPERREPITCKLYNHQEYIGNRDLDSNFHKGSTIGHGKLLYWSIVWHSKSGNATVYPINGKSSRYVSGDVTITIHFNHKKQKS
jgi:hypothetical protein